MHPKYLPLPIVDAGSLAWETNVPIDSTLTSYGLRVEEMARTSACAPLYQSFSAVSSPVALNAPVREAQRRLHRFPVSHSRCEVNNIGKLAANKLVWFFPFSNT